MKFSFWNEAKREAPDFFCIQIPPLSKHLPPPWFYPYFGEISTSPWFLPIFSEPEKVLRLGGEVMRSLKALHLFPQKSASLGSWPPGQYSTLASWGDGLPFWATRPIKVLDILIPQPHFARDLSCFEWLSQFFLVSYVYYLLILVQWSRLSPKGIFCINFPSWNWIWIIWLWIISLLKQQVFVLQPSFSYLVKTMLKNENNNCAKSGNFPEY